MWNCHEELAKDQNASSTVAFDWKHAKSGENKIRQADYVSAGSWCNRKVAASLILQSLQKRSCENVYGADRG